MSCTCIPLSVAPSPLWLRRQRAQLRLSSAGLSYLATAPADRFPFSRGSNTWRYLRCADMLVVFRLPEWPAAAVALIRFVVAVSGPRGLHHSDNIVRQCCIDLLGVLVSQLYFEAHMAEAEQPWLSQISGQGPRIPQCCLLWI